MRRITIYLILLGIISANAELRTPIVAEKVDSVIIRTIDWSVRSFGHYGIDRKAFDKLYEFLLTDSIFREKEGMSVDSIIIKDDISKFLFSTIINYVPQYTLEETMLSPNEIWEKSKGFEYNMGIMADGYYNGDPLEIRGKIRIYLKSGEIITAYMSHTLLDIFNERYIAFNLSIFISNYLSYMFKQKAKPIKEGIPFPDKDYDYRGALKMASADSIKIYKKVEQRWLQHQTINDTQYISKLADDILLHSKGTTTKITPKFKIEFYGDSFCVPIYVQGELFELYEIVYRMPYNLEDHISKPFLNTP